jgi:ankyrin repeat protein
MNIEKLLAESNLVAAAELDDGTYDTEEFEDDLDGTIDSSRGSAANQAPQSKASILKAAAAQVAKEDKVIADKVFNVVADDLSEDLLRKKQSERNPEDILANASRAANENLNKIDSTEAEKYSDNKIEEEKGDDGEEEEDSNEGEDDEGEDDESDPDLNQALLFAVWNDKVENVRNLLKKGAYYFSRDRHGWTPLHWAASKGHDRVLEVLVEHVKQMGKNVVLYVNAQDKITGWTALHVSTCFVFLLNAPRRSAFYIVLLLFVILFFPINIF